MIDLTILETPTAAAKYRDALAEIREEYLAGDGGRTWIVGFSGGKDSTLVTQLVFEMLLGLPRSERTRSIIILSNDTLVESPVLMQHLKKVLKKIEDAAVAYGLPITTTITEPAPDQTFWVNLIGRGYPSPNKQFRWCTDRMKIQPMRTFVLEGVSATGEVILLLGVRSDESITRARSVERHTVEGSRLHPHTELRGCWIYRPILKFTTDDVWQVLLQRPCAWGGSHRELVTLYKNATGGECALVIDHDQAPSCGTGSARFGCWTCTVVDKDRSMEGIIENGEEHLESLLDFRDWLRAIRNHPEYERNGVRRNGEPGAGPFTIEARKKILSRLLDAQQESGLQLISQAEIDLIMQLWAEDVVTRTNQLFEGVRKVTNGANYASNSR